MPSFPRLWAFLSSGKCPTSNSRIADAYRSVLFADFRHRGRAGLGGNEIIDGGRKSPERPAAGAAIERDGFLLGIARAKAHGWRRIFKLAPVCNQPYSRWRGLDRR